MSPLVVDASAALALLAGGPGRAAVRDALRERIVAGDRLLVPPSFWVELIDALARRHRQPPAAVVEAVYELERLGVETAELGRAGTLALIDAVGRGLSAADAPYLVLAESADAGVLTATPLLASVAGERATLVAGRRGGAPRPDRSWARWKGARSYLRELRSAL